MTSLNTPSSHLPADKKQAEIIRKLEQVFPAVVCDILDKKGHRDQTMAPDIRPLWPKAQLVGVAITLHCQPVDGLPPKGEEYKLLFEAIDSLTPGQVVVTDRVDSCVWGELTSEAAQRRGARGIVTEGYLRDAQGIVALEFAAFCKGLDCRDMLGRAEVAARNVEIVCGGVKVAPGDFVIAGYDGVVVIPKHMAEEVADEAFAKAAEESRVQIALRNGMSVTEAWNTYGIM